MGLEEVFGQACDKGEIPGAVVIADGPDGYHYEKAFGTVSLKKGAPVLESDAVFWLASCTKLMTTVAAMQCVERSLFSLDEDVCRFLPELKDIEILSSFDRVTKAPVLTKNTTPITMRHLLTHTSGLSYDHFSPVLQKWSKYRKRRISNGRMGSVTQSYTFPLLFAPGTSWEYGSGIDWAGLLISRATNLTLSFYLSRNVFEPLGMTSCTFRPYENPSIYNKVMAMAERDGPINPIYGTTMAPNAPVITSRVKHPRDVKVTDDYGGAGCFSSAPDFAKLLQSLADPSVKQVLSSASIAAMFEPQLGVKSKKRLATLLSFGELNNSMGGLPQAGDGGMDWGLGGQMVMKGVEGRRKERTMFWGGLPNLFWWVDRKSGISGIFATQVMPTGDPKCVELMGMFEGVVYEAIDSKRRERYREKL